MSDGSDRTNPLNGHDAGSQRDFDALRPHLDSLRRDRGDTPDFTRAVLAEVGHRRAWLDSRERRWVWIGRLTAAAAVVAVVAGVFVVQRHTEIEHLASGPPDRPIDALVRSVSNDSQRVDVRTLDGAAFGRAVIAQPVARAMRIGDRPRRTSNVWAIQRIGDPGIPAVVPMADGSFALAATSGFPGVAGFGQAAFLPPSGQPMMLEAGESWTGSLVVPAGFQAPVRRLPGFSPVD